MVQQQALPISSPTLTLRDYQKQVIAQIYSRYRTGTRSIMLVSPTGSGKTLTATQVIKDAISRDCRVLFIVHREPLIDQTVQTLEKYGINSSTIGYVKAGYPLSTGNEKVIVASIQTLACRDYPSDIGLVIFDESHTTSFYKSAQQLIYHYAQAPIVALSKTKFLHLTATPFRTKRKEYFPHIQAIVRAPDIRSLIRMGFLVTPRHFGYGGLLDLTKLDTGHDGDYKQSQLRSMCANANYNEEIVRRLLKVSPDKKGIVFCAGVEQSKLLTRLFNDNSISAAHIDANTTSEQRRELFGLFRQGIIQIICSVGTLTEGFDEPSVEVVIIARPTKSLALLIQMCGRGLRLSPHTGKRDCLLLDFGENFSRLQRIDAETHISLCPTETRRSSTRKCPQCEAVLDPLILFCPECGYEFPHDDPVEQDEKKESPSNDIESTFGELFDEATRKKVAYIRSQRRKLFKANSQPDQIWTQWDTCSRNILCHDWLKHAIFGSKPSPLAQYQMFAYLQSFAPKNANWIPLHMTLEFGIAIDPDKLTWWSTLQVTPSTPPDEVGASYSKLFAVASNDDEKQILNYAYTRFQANTDQ